MIFLHLTQKDGCCKFDVIGCLSVCQSVSVSVVAYLSNGWGDSNAVFLRETEFAWVFSP